MPDTTPFEHDLNFVRQSDLSDFEYASLEKVAVLRGLCGRYRAALGAILDEAAPGTTTHALAQKALEVPQ